MSQAHAEIRISADGSEATKGFNKMKRDAADAARSVESEFKRMDRAAESLGRSLTGRGSRGGRGAHGRGSMWGQGGGSYIAGSVAMQAQDIAVQAQMGASLSRIAVQQGSQIASFFGPHGMILGGILAIGIAAIDAATGIDKMNKRLAETAKRGSEMHEANQSLVKIGLSDSDEIEVLKTRLKIDERAAETKRRNLQYEADVRAIRRSGASESVQDAAIEIKNEKRKMEAAVESKEFIEKMNEKERKAEEARKKQEERDAEKRMRELEEMQREYERGEKERRGKFVKEVGDMEQESIVKSSARYATAHERKMSELQTEEEAIKRLGGFWDPSTLEQQRAYFNMPPPSEDEKNDLERRLRVNRTKQSEEIANELHERTFGKRQSDQRRRLRSEAKARREEEKWQNRISDTGGLVDIHRGIGGKIISGRDPITGKRVSGDDAIRRARSAIGVRGDSNPKVGLSEESITSLVNAIEKLLAK